MLHLGRKLLRIRQFSQRPRYETLFSFYRRRNAPLILNTKPIHTPSKEEWAVRYLTCKTQILETLWSAKSLLRFVSVPIHFHDDGSLDRQAVSLLKAHFPNATIISRAESDARTIPLLTSHNKQMRDRLMFFLRVFDFQVYAEGQPYLQVDSDVLFYRSPNEVIAELRLDNPRVRYNRDPDDIGTMGWPIKGDGFNAGVLFIPKPLDFQRIDHLLGELGEPSFMWAAEQSILKLEADRIGTAPLPNTYDIWEKNWPDVVSEHYTSTSRLNMYRVGYPLIMKHSLKSRH